MPTVTTRQRCRYYIIGLSDAPASISSVLKYVSSRYWVPADKRMPRLARYTLPDRVDNIVFLCADSPGAVFQVLARRLSLGSMPVLFLSDALHHTRMRALFTVDHEESVWWELAVAALAPAFPKKLVWLRRGGETWQATVFLEGAEAVREELPAELPGTWWERWQPTARQHWARKQAVPLERVNLSLPIIEYEIVARLDQRSLLQEDRPRLYRFLGEGDSGTFSATT